MSREAQTVQHQTMSSATKTALPE